MKELTITYDVQITEVVDDQDDPSLIDAILQKGAESVEAGENVFWKSLLQQGMGCYDDVLVKNLKLFPMEAVDDG